MAFAFQLSDILILQKVILTSFLMASAMYPLLRRPFSVLTIQDIKLTARNQCPLTPTSKCLSASLGLQEKVPLLQASQVHGGPNSTNTNRLQCPPRGRGGWFPPGRHSMCANPPAIHSKPWPPPNRDLKKPGNKIRSTGPAPTQNGSRSSETIVIFPHALRFKKLRNSVALKASWDHQHTASHVCRKMPGKTPPATAVVHRTGSFILYCTGALDSDSRMFAIE